MLRLAQLLTFSRLLVALQLCIVYNTELRAILIAACFV